MNTRKPVLRAGDLVSMLRPRPHQPNASVIREMIAERMNRLRGTASELRAGTINAHHAANRIERIANEIAQPSEQNVRKSPLTGEPYPRCESEGDNTMSATSDTKAFFSSKFLRTVRSYHGYVIVPVDSTGARGGGKRTFDIWSGDQQARYNRKVESLSAAKALIDSGSLIRVSRDAQSARDGVK